MLCIDLSSEIEEQSKNITCIDLENPRRFHFNDHQDVAS